MRPLGSIGRAPRRVHRLSLFSQQLYQTLSDFDIRFYMYEILKVSSREALPRAESRRQLLRPAPRELRLAPRPGCGTAGRPRRGEAARQVAAERGGRG